MSGTRLEISTNSKQEQHICLSDIPMMIIILII